MKAKDFKTLESLLKEYGMNPGISTPVGQQTSGSVAKATQKSPSKEKSQSPTMAKNVSPTTAKIQRQQQAKEEPFNKIDAGEQELDTVLKDKDGNEVGTVVSQVGDKPNVDAVVIKDPKNQFRLVEPDEELFVDNPDFVEEGKLGKKLSKDRKLYKLGRKIKKLTRKHKLREQGEELIFEINFNKKEIAQDALNLPIKCGFEAETSWDSVYGSGGDDDGDWLYEYNWYDIEDFIRDQEGSNAAARVEDSYNEWIVENVAPEFEGDIIDDMVSDREEDEYYLNKYIEDELSEDDIEEYKERILDDLPEEEHDEYADWDFLNWGRQYVEEELLDEYKDWLREDIRDNGEAFDDAIDTARSEYDMDYWANEEYGSWASCLSEHDIYLYDPDRGGEGGGQEEVAEYLTDWIDENSQYKDVKAGEYHNRAGDTTQDYWRVEDDSSIQTSGTGSEIISPVYPTPRKMLEEMKSLFAWLENQDVDTNSSTGLHVTMSLDSDDREKINPVKLAVLLGDKYLLSTFGRENNSYAKSQYKNLEKLGHKLKANPDAKTIQQIEDILSSGINRDKFSSINFKDQRDSNTGNQLIEFRIGGGSDYHRDYPKVVKAVIRYAATMQAAHSDKLYNRDYATALYRLINNIGKISADDEERVKDRINPDVEAPAVDVLKDYFSKDNYVEHLRYLAAAYNLLAEYRQLKNKQNEDVETDGPDADRLQDLLNKAQKYFAGAVAQAGYDFSQGHNRLIPNAKSIGILRSALKDFELDYDKLSNLIDANSIDTGDRYSDLTPKQILGRVKNGVDKLFKKDVVQEPEYLSANQVEKLITGMWNAVHSGKLQDGQQAIKFAKLLADASGKSENVAAAWLDQANSGSRGREYKEFHKSVTQGSYGEQAMFTPGSPADSKKLKAFIDHLKQYPDWEHPVSKDHDPRRSTFDDSYVDNALSKMLIKLRSRWDHLEDIREENPGLYIDSMREIAKLVTDLVSTVRTSDEYMHHIYDDLKGTDHNSHRDGETYFGMLERHAEDLLNIVERIDKPIYSFDDPVAHQLRDRIQSYIRRSYDRYYLMKSRENSGFYKIGSVPDLIKKRTDAIKEFLTGFDKVAQSHGFDSQSSEIANKKQLDNKQAKFKKKYGPQTFKVDAFDFGGYIFAEKDFAQGLPHLAPEGVARALQQTSNIHRTDHGELLIMPSIHYFTALEASKMLANPTQFKNTWRWEKAEEVLRKFESKYKIDFHTFGDKYVDINDDNQRARTNLRQQNVEFTNKLGDGREGVGNFGPLMPRHELNGPDGEPFEPSSAVAWRINRDNKKAGTPSHLQGGLGELDSVEVTTDDYAKAREKYPMFDVMMQSGVGSYIMNADLNRLVKFLVGDFSEKYKQAVIKALIQNKEGGGEPADMQQALALGRNNMESVFDKFDKLSLQEQIELIAKVNKNKIDEAWSKKYKDSINCSNPKGFSQKAHCAGKKKKGVKEGAVPDNDRVSLLNKILADHFPASDLKSQMLAYWAIPDPRMLKDFRAIRAQGGDDACLRPVLRSYAQAKLPEVELKKINLNESAISESPQELQQIGMKLGQSQSIIKYIDRISKQSKCNNNANPRCKTLNARKERVTKMYNDLVSLLASQSQETYQQGVHAGKQGFKDFRKQVDSLLRKLALKINGKVEFLMVPDDYSESEVPTHNPHTGRKLNQKDAKKAVTEKAAIEGVINVLRKYFTDPEFDDKDGDGVKDTAAQQSDNADIRNREFVIEFLTDAANGNILRMEDVIAVGAKGGMPIASMDDIVEKVAKEKGKERYFKFYKSLDDAGIMKQTAENTTSGNVGPGELALLLLCAPAEKGKRGDLLVDGKEVEIKSGSYGGSDGTKSGGKFNSKRLEKGSGAGANLQNALIKYFKTQNIDFKKTYSTWVTSNTFSDYKFNPKTFNMPALSKKQIDDVWNPYFKHLNLNDEQVKDIAEIFALCTFNKDIAYDDHLAEVKKQIGIAFGKKDAYDRLLKGTYYRGQLKGGPLGQLIQALQFTSYQYSNDDNTKLHDTILYMNKANKAITTVSDVKDFYEKMSKGYLVTAKDISLTDTQQTAGHSITAGLLK